MMQNNSKVNGPETSEEISDDIAGDRVIDKGEGKLESGYFNSAVEIKKKLDKVSPSMCLAKWNQVSIHLTNGQTQSCYHPATHKIPLDELKDNPSALHNTKHKMEQRRLMKEGVRPKECEYCWNIEDAPGNHLSDRHYRSGEEWSIDMYDEIVSQPHDYDVKPRYVEVNFNHACQLSCSYCSPHISSAWLDEVKKFGPYPTINIHNNLDWVKQAGLMPVRQDQPNPYRDAFWEWWPKVYPELRVFRMTGGEPLLDINTFRVFDYVIANPSPRLQIALTSNMSTRTELMDKFINKAKIIADRKLIDHLALFASVDSVGAQAEYIRHGLHFETFLKHVERYLFEVDANSVSFINTFNCMSVTGLPGFIDMVLDLRSKYSKTFQKVWFDTPMLRYPAWQSIQVLPERYHGLIEESIRYMRKYAETRETRLNGIKDFEIAKLERVLAWMKLEVAPEKLMRDRADFYRFFVEHDRRRGTDFLKTFPEMADFWELCEKASKEYDALHGVK
jgi:MoaA/NifB/PqqE/SkfB family radical SAM enzyme